MNSYMTKWLKVLLVLGLISICLMTYATYKTGIGYVDAATGVYVSEPISSLNLVLLTISTPTLGICLFIGFAGIGTELKKKNREGAIGIALWLVIVFALDFVLPRIVIPKVPQEAYDKAEVCKYSTQCGEKDGDITLCYYHSEQVKCPVAIISESQYKIEEKK